MKISQMPSQASYEEELRAYRLLYSRACGATVIVLVLFGVTLDCLIYPEEQMRFALARIITSGIIALAIAFLYTERGKRHVQIVTFAWLLLPQIMIAWMIHVTRGETSLFYAGLILTIFAVGSLFPVGHRYALLFSLFTVLFYYLACALRVHGIQDQSQFLFHSIIIAFAAGASTIYAYFHEKGRRQLFELKGELAKKNTELASTNKDLLQIKGQMLQQEKMVALGTLAAGLLHEVNNPVNFCLMAIELAKEEPQVKTSSVLEECLTDAKQGMQRVQHIVSDLKIFAYRKNEATAEKAHFLFEKALDTAIRLTGHELKGVAVTRDLPLDTLVRGDEAAIIGVLINLLSNAVLAMRNVRRPQYAICVSALWEDERLRVSVRDNGPGIPLENLARVFEPFFTTRAVGQGLGLGLSISYGVIERHGGTLSADSALGEWTQMIFDLPRAE